MLPPASESKISTIVADANLMLGSLLSEALKRHKELRIVACAADSTEVMEILRTTPVDVTLISASLRNGPLAGFALVREVRIEYPSVRSVLLLDRSERELIVDAFRAGARGILDRSSDCKTIYKCLRRVHQGQTWATSKELEVVFDAMFRTAGLRVIDAKGAMLLSKREEQVVGLVADGLSNRDIAHELGLSEHTIKNHLFRIFEKLGISSRVELVLYAFSSFTVVDAAPVRVTASS
jgi:two-component system nitrate/nitrite response regulator NarL